MSTQPPAPSGGLSRWQARLRAIDLLRWLSMPALSRLPCGFSSPTERRSDRQSASGRRAAYGQGGVDSARVVLGVHAGQSAVRLAGGAAPPPNARPVRLRLRQPHLLVLVGLDYGFALRLLRADLTGKPFIWVGAAALLILAALAATSFPAWKKRLGKNWKRLHRLAYLAVILVVVHFAWARKGNLTALSGDILQPLAFGSVAIGLLALRLPGVRRWIARRRAGSGMPARVVE